MAEVAWTPQALQLWKEIVRYLDEHSADPRKAERIGEQLLEAADRLELFPRMGRVVPEFGKENVREIVMVRPYRIIYLIVEDTCHVVAVAHSKRDLRNVVRPEDLEDL